ncbi:MAG TPA: DUF411 domain-containing protein [Longimicrobiales bacterium]|nr:DUF411 domain-containing protein [Longimicrobiales bacterium]
MKRFFLTTATVLAAAACGNADATPEARATAATAQPAATTAAAAPQALPTVVVYKTEACGCCNGWVEHLRSAGFQVDARNVADLMSIKGDAGVPAGNAACHTALVDGYVVEGHVPADVIKRLLAERPDVAGLAVPGMPTGSPGMEGPGAEPYDVLTFDRQGRNTVYTTVDPR